MLSFDVAPFAGLESAQLLGAAGACVSLTHCWFDAPDRFPAGSVCVIVKLYVASEFFVTVNEYAEAAHVILSVAEPAMFTVAPVSHAPEIARLDTFEYVGDVTGEIMLGAPGAVLSIV